MYYILYYIIIYVATELLTTAQLYLYILTLCILFKSCVTQNIFMKYEYSIKPFH